MIELMSECQDLCNLLCIPSRGKKHKPQKPPKMHICKTNILKNRYLLTTWRRQQASLYFGLDTNCKMQTWSKEEVNFKNNMKTTEHKQWMEVVTIFSYLQIVTHVTSKKHLKATLTFSLQPEFQKEDQRKAAWTHRFLQLCNADLDITLQNPRHYFSTHQSKYHPVLWSCSNGIFHLQLTLCSQKIFLGVDVNVKPLRQPWHTRLEADWKVFRSQCNTIIESVGLGAVINTS